jgi:hypothetical protein
MPNGLLILFTFALYGLFVYGPELARIIGRKRKVIGKSYKIISINRDKRTITVKGDVCQRLANDTFRLDDCDTLREVNARREH